MCLKWKTGKIETFYIKINLKILYYFNSPVTCVCCLCWGFYRCTWIDINTVDFTLEVKYCIFSFLSILYGVLYQGQLKCLLFWSVTLFFQPKVNKFLKYFIFSADFPKRRRLHFCDRHCSCPSFHFMYFDFSSSFFLWVN